MAILIGDSGDNKTRKQTGDANLSELSAMLGAVLSAFQPPEAAYAEPKVTARLATATADRLAAFRLRYEVYIAEQGKPYPEADHHERLLSDELDADGAIFVTESNREITGTVRANWFTSAVTNSHYADVFELNRFREFAPGEISVCTRLAVSPGQRQSIAAAMLFEGIYDHGLTRGTRLCFVTCAPILVRLFRRYGFREYAPPIHDAVVGTLHRMLLVLDDFEHLSRTNSPFVSIARKYGISATPRSWLTQFFDDYKVRRAAT